MKKIIFFLGLIITVISCSSGDSGGDNSGSKNYDRAALLANWSDNIIIPGYENYQIKEIGRAHV